MYTFLCSNKHLSYSSAEEVEGGCPVCGNTNLVRVSDNELVTTMHNSIDNIVNSLLRLSMLVEGNASLNNIIKEDYPFTKDIGKVIEDVFRWETSIEYNLSKDREGNYGD